MSTEDEIFGWHHWPNGQEFEQAPGAGDGPGSLVCSPWGCNGSDKTERLNCDYVCQLHSLAGPGPRLMTHFAWRQHFPGEEWVWQTLDWWEVRAQISQVRVTGSQTHHVLGSSVVWEEGLALGGQMGLIWIGCLHTRNVSQDLLGFKWQNSCWLEYNKKGGGGHGDPPASKAGSTATDAHKGPRNLWGLVS